MIMTDALENHEGCINIGPRTITKLRFADDIDSLAEEEEVQAKLVERLDKASTSCIRENQADEKQHQ